jgi:hypothetical protein
MAFNAHELARLRRIVSLVEKLIAANPKPTRGRPALSKGNDSGKKRLGRKRTRRTGRELVQFRKMIKAERKKGVSVAELAREHRVSSAYIYSLHLYASLRAAIVLLPVDLFWSLWFDPSKRRVQRTLLVGGFHAS